MSEHLFECFYYMDDFGDGERCICDRLRACERRVLDAAREAVVTLMAWPEGIESDDLSFLNYLHGVRDARTAIDALKEKE